MYEVDFTGWVRSPEELKKMEDDWKYRWRMNCRRFFKSIYHRRWWQFWTLLWWAIINQKRYW